MPEIYGSDNGAPCATCQQTIYNYSVEQGGQETFIEWQCVTCHARGSFYLMRFCPQSAAEVSRAHREKSAIETLRGFEGTPYQWDGALRRLAGLFLLVFLFASAASAQTLTGTVTRVSDGDTIKVGPVRVRLHGIDAPETDQDCTLGGKPYRCGIDATNALKALAEGKPVTCAVLTTDRYGRLVARCRVGAVDLSRAMIQAGWAIADRRYLRSHEGDAILIQDEARAQTARVGIWRGSFQAPWEWRKGGAK